MCFDGQVLLTIRHNGWMFDLPEFDATFLKSIHDYDSVQVEHLIDTLHWRTEIKERMLEDLGLLNEDLDLVEFRMKPEPSDYDDREAYLTARYEWLDRLEQFELCRIYEEHIAEVRELAVCEFNDLFERVQLHYELPSIFVLTCRK